MGLHATPHPDPKPTAPARHDELGLTSRFDQAFEGHGRNTGPFPFGVAAFVSGEASARISTVVAPAGHSAPTPDQVAWTVCTSSEQIAHGMARPEPDGTVWVDVTGLPLDTELRYRFSLGSKQSRSGRLRFPTMTGELRIAVASCVRSVDAEPLALARVAAHRPDLVLHVGDYIYEDDKAGQRQAPDPPWTCRTADDFRARLAQCRADVGVQDLHAAAPWITVWDDHDVADDLWARGAPAIGAAETALRRAEALRARRTFLPEPRGGGPGPFDRHLVLSGRADVVVVDARHQRGAPAGRGPTVVPTDADRDEMLGPEQWDWLDAVLRACDQPWLLLVSSVQLSPLRLCSLPTRRGFSPLVNPGQWDGYPASRRRLLSMIDRHLGGREIGVVALSGDLHGRFVVSQRHDEMLCEITTPAVSAPPFADLVRRSLRLPIPTRALEWWLRRWNQHFSHIDLGRNGASIIDVSDSRLRVADEFDETVAAIARNEARR